MTSQSRTGILTRSTSTPSASTSPLGRARWLRRSVGVARQNADYRLRQLEDEGMVRSKRVDNSLAWSLSEVNSDSNEVDPADDFWETETYEGASMSASAIDDGDNEAE